MKHTIDFQPKLFTALKNYDRRKFTADLMAGIIVGIVALPLAIAFGIASGVSPEKGLITAIIGGFIVSFLGGSNVQIGGPTGAFIVIVAGIISQYGIEGLAIATVMAGIILVLLGLFKLGVVIKFIPYPIIVGFTAGIALTIFSTQIKDLFGLRIDGAVPEDFIGKWAVYFQHFDTTNLWALGIGLVSILIILLTPKVSRKIPGSLAAIILVTVASYLLKRYCGIDTIETIGDRYSINPAIPAPAGFSFNLETIRGMMKNPKADIAVLFTTLLLTVVFDLTIAIAAGLLMAVVLFMRRIMESTNISVIHDQIDMTADAESNHRDDKVEVAEGVEVYEIDGPFFFGIASKFDDVMHTMGEKSKVRIIRMRKVPFIDSTGLHNLSNLIRASRKEGIEVILSGVNPSVRETLLKAGIDRLVGEENICANIHIAAERANRLVAGKTA